MRTHTHRALDGTLTTTKFDMSWDQIRRLRQPLLDESDWRAGKDVVLANAWKVYRQALRDITEHPDANTAADNWPVVPDE